MATIQRYGSGAPWESIAGYCRVVRAGSHVWIAGTTAVDEAGHVVGEGDAGQQTRFILEKMITALEKIGVHAGEIVRTRLFVKDINDWEAVAKTHGEFFSDHPPVCTLLAVEALIDPKMLVEIEAEAFVVDAEGGSND